MGKGHRKNDMPKTFRRIQLEFQISKHSENWSDAQDATAAAAKQMQKKKEKEKNPASHFNFIFLGHTSCDKCYFFP